MDKCQYLTLTDLNLVVSSGRVRIEWPQKFNGLFSTVAFLANEDFGSAKQEFLLVPPSLLLDGFYPQSL